MVHKYSAALSIAAGLLAASALPARANTLASATATVVCTGYTLTVISNADLTQDTTYTIDYSFVGNCAGGNSDNVSSSITFTATPGASATDATGAPVVSTISCPTSNTCTATETVTNMPQPPGNTITCQFTGSATLTSSGSNVNMNINLQGAGNPATVVCPSLSGCVIPPSGTAISGSPVSWNGFTAPAGSVVWINAHMDASNVPKNTSTVIYFTGVTLVVNTTSYALPNGQVVFNPATSTPTTVVNADGSWTTTVNPAFNNDIFFDGQAIPVDANMENGGHGNTGSTLSFSTNSSDSALSFQWQWGAAVYTSWPGNAPANIEPVHAGQQAGAPLNPAVEADLIQGPRGGGGSNFTGSWSGTGKGTCP
jgi:hypothetical protein